MKKSIALLIGIALILLGTLTRGYRTEIIVCHISGYARTLLENSTL